MIDTVVEQIVDVPVLQGQEGIAEQIVDFAVPPIKEELAEASASGAHPRAHRGVDSDTPSCHRSQRKVAVVCQGLRQERIHEHIVEWTVFMPQITEKVAVVCQGLLQQRIHEHIVEWTVFMPQITEKVAVVRQGSASAAHPGRVRVPVLLVRSVYPLPLFLHLVRDRQEWNLPAYLALTRENPPDPDRVSVDQSTLLSE